MLPVASRAFLKNHQQPTDIQHFLDMPLVDYHDTYSAFNHWIKKNQRNLYTQAQKKLRAVTSSNNVVLKQLVLQCMGMGFLHLESIRAELETGELIPIFPSTQYQPIHVDVDVVYKRKHALGFVHLEFIKLLEKHSTRWMQ